MRLAVRGSDAFVYTAARTLDPKLPSVAFIHGGEQDHSAWTAQSRYFAHHGWNALAFDLPAHGRSDGPPLGCIEAMADWTVSLLDAAGVEAAALVGHSMGSLVALDAAARHRDRVRAIAMAGVSTPMPVSESLLAAARDDLATARRMMVQWSFSDQGKLGAGATPGLSITGAGLRLMQRAAHGVLHTDLAACNAYADGLARARDVRCPALLLLGGRDRMTPPRAAQALFDALPDARRVVLDGSGHALMAERPNEVLDALIGFLAPLAADSATASA